MLSSLKFILLNVCFSNVIFSARITKAYPILNPGSFNSITFNVPQNHDGRNKPNPGNVATIDAYDKYLATITRLNKLLRTLFKEGYGDLSNYKNDVLPDNANHHNRARLEQLLRFTSGLNIKWRQMPWLSGFEKPNRFEVPAPEEFREAVFQHPRRSARLLSKILLEFLKSMRYQDTWSGLQTSRGHQSNDNNNDVQTDGGVRKFNEVAVDSTNDERNGDINTVLPDEGMVPGDGIGVIPGTYTSSKDMELDLDVMTKEVGKERLGPRSTENTPSTVVATRSAAPNNKQNLGHQARYRKGNVDISGGTFLTPEISQGSFTWIRPNQKPTRNRQNGDGEKWYSKPFSFESMADENKQSEDVDYDQADYQGFIFG